MPRDRTYKDTRPSARALFVSLPSPCSPHQLERSQTLCMHMNMNMNMNMRFWTCWSGVTLVSKKSVTVVERPYAAASDERCPLRAPTSSSQQGSRFGTGGETILSMLSSSRIRLAVGE